MVSSEGAAVSRARRRIRWWPVIPIVVLAAAAIVHVRYVAELDTQSRNIRTALVFIATSGLLFLWLLLLSRLPWGRRLLLCGGCIGLVAAMAGLLEIRGVSGDLVPVVEWRWTKPTSQSLPASPEILDPGDVELLTESPTDYPQFGGPERTSKLPRVHLQQDWKAHPLERLWQQPIGAAWSGFAVAGDYAVTTEQRGESELVTCYRVTTGDLIWTHRDESHYGTVIAGEGPRSVPTISSERVVAVGPTGILNVLQLADGAKLWSRNVLSENEVAIPEWGFCCAPLVTDGKVIVRTGNQQGRSLAAYSFETGDLVWASGDDGGDSSFSSPVFAEIDGVEQVLSFNAPAVTAHALDDGELLWSYGWGAPWPKVAMPVVLPDGRVLISSGYGVGSHLVQVHKDANGEWSTEKIWESKRLKSKFANVIIHDGHIYGLDDGVLACLDLETGARQWKRGRYGHGQLILAGNLLVVMAENGDVVLLEPTPEAHRELSRFRVLNGKSWNPHAIAGEYLLVRNDKEAACYRLPLIPE